MGTSAAPALRAWRGALFTAALGVLAGCGGPVSKPCTSDADCAPSGVCSAGACRTATPPGDGGTVTVRRLISLTLSVDRHALTVGEQAHVVATAAFEDGAEANVSASVQWSAQPATVLLQRPAAGTDFALFEAVASGEVRLSAASGAVGAAAVTITVLPSGDAGPVDAGGRDAGPSDAGPADAGGADAGPADAGWDAGAGDAGPSSFAEVRAVWVTRFAYSTAADVRGVIDRAADAGANVVFFQIRGAGDAYYRSTLEPWAKGLTGTLGQDPGWDPLQTAIDEAHARGLQLHAYFNVFSGWACAASKTCACKPTGASPTCTLPEASPAGAPTHWLRSHPDSMAVDSSGANQDVEYYWVSPASTAYRAHVVAVATELLTNYAVDGLHLDRVRYPGSWASYDAASAGAPTAATARADWQRSQVNAMVGALYQAVKTTRPQAVLSASVWGIHTRLPGCSTSEGNPDFFQDSIGWVDQGLIDWIVPMIYWDLGTGCTDFGRLLAQFSGTTRGARVVAGMLAKDASGYSASKVNARLTWARDAGAAGGCLFSSTSLDTYSGWTPLRQGPWSRDAGVPGMTWR